MAAFTQLVTDAQQTRRLQAELDAARTKLQQQDARLAQLDGATVRLTAQLTAQPSWQAKAQELERALAGRDTAAAGQRAVADKRVKELQDELAQALAAAQQESSQQVQAYRQSLQAIDSKQAEQLAAASAEFETRISSLAQRVQAAERELEKSRGLVVQVAADKQAELNAAYAKVTQAQEALEQAQQQVAQKADLEKQVNELTGQLERQQTQITTQTEALRTQSDAHAVAQQNKAALETQLQQATADAAQTAELTTQLAKATSELKAAEDRQQAAEAGLARQASQVAAFQASLQDLNQKLSRLGAVEQQKATVQQERDQATAKLAEIITALRVDDSPLGDDIAALKQRVQELQTAQTQLQQAQEAQEAARAETRKYQAAMVAAQLVLAQQRAVNARQKDELDRLVESNQQLAQRVQAASKNLQEDEQRISQQVSQLQQSQQQVTQTRRAAETALSVVAQDYEVLNFRARLAAMLAQLTVGVSDDQAKTIAAGLRKELYDFIKPLSEAPTPADLDQAVKAFFIALPAENPGFDQLIRLLTAYNEYMGVQMQPKFGESKGFFSGKYLSLDELRQLLGRLISLDLDRDKVNALRDTFAGKARAPRAKGAAGVMP